jgi:hypothetical protein
MKGEMWSSLRVNKGNNPCRITGVSSSCLDTWSDSPQIRISGKTDFINIFQGALNGEDLNKDKVSKDDAQFF